MKFILIKSNQKIIIDDDDFERVNQHSWWISGKYVYCQIWKKENSKTIRIHQFIMGKKEGFQIDHINGNTLDNRRENLRFCTYIQNNRNRTSKNKFGYKGVTKMRKAFLAQIKVGEKRIHGKSRKTIREAAIDYNNLAKLYFGEFACLNVID